MAERAGDSGFVQRKRHDDGSATIRLPEGEAGADMAALLEERRSAFVARYGRKPGPGDPVFFDANATGHPPRPWTEPELREALSRPGVAVELGLDPAVVGALLEVGYIVTDQNAHLFSAEEVRAFKAAVERHQGQGR
jgi:hypothetical protein